MSRLDLNTWRILKTFFYYQRFWNAVKISTSYFLSKLGNKTYVWGLPYSIAIEPTTACNLRCPHCPSGLKIFNRDTGKISVENFEKFIEARKELIKKKLLFLLDKANDEVNSN